MHCDTDDGFIVIILINIKEGNENKSSPYYLLVGSISINMSALLWNRFRRKKKGS